jgi:Zn finger protein HypA/HybF involved in hydrogenase expression
MTEAGQLPCPDCGSPVQPEREQLCPRCGYPLMFLRQGGGGDAQAQSIPRSPNERDDDTRGPQPRSATRELPAVGAPRGHLPCRACGYPNEAVRFRCERCGAEMRPSRPQAVVLGPAAVEPAARRGGRGWLIALAVLAVLALGALFAVLLWRASA